jgi:hypothetical protein
LASRCDGGLYTVKARTVVKALAAGAFLMIVLVGCQTTTDVTTTDAAPSGRLVVSASNQLSDGEEVVFEGTIVVDEGETRLVGVITGMSPPTYAASLVLRGVDIDQLDLFRFPPTLSDIRWSDHYVVSGTIQDGELFVDSLRYLRANPSRQTHENCEAAVDNPEDVETCPEELLRLYRDNSGG